MNVNQSSNELKQILKNRLFPECLFSLCNRDGWFAYPFALQVDFFKVLMVKMFMPFHSF